MVVDCNESFALTESIPEPKLCEQKDSKLDYHAVMEYRGISFLNYGEYNSFIIEAIAKQYMEQNEYDYIFIDFGFRSTHPVLVECDTLVMVSDQQKHNYKRLSLLPRNSKQKRVLLIKDFCRGGINERQLLRELRYDREECSVYRLPINEPDTEIKLECNCPAIAPLSELSVELRKILEKLSQLFVPEADGKLITRAYRAASTGK